MSKNPMIQYAEVAHRDVVTEQGAGTQHFVRAPDGYLIECGHSHDRAYAIMTAINTWLDTTNGNIVTEWPAAASMPF